MSVCTKLFWVFKLGQKNCLKEIYFRQERLRKISDFEDSTAKLKRKNKQTKNRNEKN